MKWMNSPDDDVLSCMNLIERYSKSNWEKLLYRARLEGRQGHWKESRKLLRASVERAPKMMSDWVESCSRSRDTAYLDFVSEGDGVMRYFFLKKWSAAAVDLLPLMDAGPDKELMQLVSVAWEQRTLKMNQDQ
ncbi:hypothetical protein P4E94_00265 [Pontiellaceae bacterium B12219]|nr:hypothetical protein [Pontiellaceae bacterium B12219]